MWNNTLKNTSTLTSGCGPVRRLVIIFEVVLHLLRFYVSRSPVTVAERQGIHDRLMIYHKRGKAVPEHV